MIYFEKEVNMSNPFWSGFIIGGCVFGIGIIIGYWLTTDLMVAWQRYKLSIAIMQQVKDGKIEAIDREEMEL